MLKRAVYLYLLLLSFAVISNGILALNYNPEISTAQTKESVFVLLETSTEYSIKGNYSTLISIMNKFELRNITSILDMKSLEGADVLVLLGPKTLSDINIEVLEQFIREGGSVLFLIPEDFEEIKELLEFFGIDVLGKSYDNKSYYIYNSSILANSSQMIVEHPIIKSSFGIVESVVIPKALGLNITEPKSPIIKDVKKFVYKIIWAPNSTFADLNGNGKFDEDEPRGENITFAIGMELWWGSKIVIFPSAAIFTDETLANTTKFDNLELLINTIYWLGGKINKLNINVKELGDIEMNSSVKWNLDVTFNLTNENDELIDANVYGIISLLDNIIGNFSAEYDNESKMYTVVFNVSVLNKSAIYNLYLLAYKKFYGFTWVKIGRILYSELKQESKKENILFVILGVLIPGIVSIFGLVRVFERYKRAREIVRKTEDKIRKGMEK